MSQENFAAIINWLNGCPDKSILTNFKKAIIQQAIENQSVTDNFNIEDEKNQDALVIASLVRDRFKDQLINQFVKLNLRKPIIIENLSSVEEEENAEPVREPTPALIWLRPEQPKRPKRKRVDKIKEIVCKAVCFPIYY